MNPPDDADAVSIVHGTPAPDFSANVAFNSQMHLRNIAAAGIFGKAAPQSGVRPYIDESESYFLSVKDSNKKRRKYVRFLNLLRR
ncbi:MAG TPA: hypothetical protein DCZ10_00445 [Pelotomaculum sp.]|nr:hypothetical protein [Pelotomaculum sp.]